MGALTDNRKRASDVFSSIYPFQSLDSELPHDFRLPPSKKPKTPSTALLAPNLIPSETLRSSTTKIRSFPPPIPLRRPLHGPQRVVKLLNWRLRAAEKEETGFGMGNIWGIGHLHRKPEVNFDDFGSPSMSKKGKMVIQSELEDVSEGLSLEDYKRLVSGQEDNSTVSNHRSFEARDDVLSLEKITESHFPPSSSAVSDLTILTPKVDDHVMEVVVPDERSPVYKKLYEHSKKRDPKLIDLDFDIKLNEKRVSGLKKLESVFKLAAKDQIKKQEQDTFRESFIPLTDEEEDDVYQALSRSNRREVLAVHESSNIEITREILQCLRPGAWLNDEVINLYLELLKERERREPKKFLRCHFFNTFFYKKLISGRSGYDFKAVRRWTTQKKIGYDLIECDKIFVPIHKEIHWCLAVINIKDNKFQYLDSLKGIDNQVLKVLVCLVDLSLGIIFNGFWLSLLFEKHVVLTFDLLSSVDLYVGFVWVREQTQLSDCSPPVQKKIALVESRHRAILSLKRAPCQSKWGEELPCVKAIPRWSQRVKEPLLGPKELTQTQP